MSITKNVFTLKKAYELIVDGQWARFDVGLDDQEPGGMFQTGSFIPPTNGVASSPVQIPGTQWVDGSRGSPCSGRFARKVDGSLWSWGTSFGSYGGLGHNDLIDKSSPTQIGGNQWNRIDNTFRHSFATKTDGTLWSWGQTSYALGLNCTAGTGLTDRSSPTQIQGNQWMTVGQGASSAMAIKYDGTLWAWGQPSVGDNTNIARSSPTQIPGNQWTCAGGSAYNRFGLKTDGTLWTWGSGQCGALGLNSLIDRSSPTQVPGNQWVDVASGHSIALAGIKSDGTLWSWGRNYRGTLGLLNLISVSSPTQIPGTQWSCVANGRFHLIATKTDGTLWNWGDNYAGKLGINLSRAACAYTCSPVQVPGTNWIKPSANYRGWLAIKRN